MSQTKVEGETFQAILGTSPHSRGQRALFTSMFSVLQTMSKEGVSVGDLKIADAALREMADAFRVFAPYRGTRKVTMFGSARVEASDPVYGVARDFASYLGEKGWMIVTGAGPGIMAAGTEGAGRERSFGVNIRLPFEQDANPFIAQDPKLVHMRYFFTRKLMLIKESDAYAVLPGGFGTQDECFELLTLLQTGKAEPAPVVLLESEDGTYWESWDDFVRNQGVAAGWISPEDLALYKIAGSIEDASREITDFYSNYHSSRWVGDLLVLRLLIAPSKAELRDLNHRFADIVTGGMIRPTTPLPPERNDPENLDLARLALRFNKLAYGRLRLLIDALNECTG